MELQAIHLTIFCVVLGIDVLHFVQTIWHIKLSSSLLSNLISFVSLVESKSLLEIFICDKAFCCLFTVVRVVLLSCFWLLYGAAWRLKIEYFISMSTLSIKSSNNVMLIKLSRSSVAIYSQNLKEFTVFWSAVNRTFAFAPTNSIGSMSFMICSIELILCSSFFAKAIIFGLIVETLVNRHSFSLLLVMLVITQLINSLLNFCNLLCLLGKKQPWGLHSALVSCLKCHIKVTFRSISFCFFYLQYLSNITFDFQ